ncbi:MAG TPA: hypothetical protein VFW08_10245 [bacterium]|nr:hypothetical protein [bacterium]
MSFRTTRIRRRICRCVAELAIQHAARIGAKVLILAGAAMLSYVGHPDFGPAA